jgi:hypothetical protein
VQRLNPIPTASTKEGQSFAKDKGLVTHFPS